jgi:transposase InsO family protein
MRQRHRVSLDFALTVHATGIRHRYITPRRPEQNGKVERSHRIDDEELWQRHSFASFDDGAVALEAWERRYIGPGLNSKSDTLC